MKRIIWPSAEFAMKLWWWICILRRSYYPSPAATFRRRIRKTVKITPAKNRRCAAINSIFHCCSTWPCSPGSHEQESVLFTANEIKLTEINVPKIFRIWERFGWQVGRLRVILNRDRIHMNFGEFRWIQWWFRSTVDGAQYRPLNSGEFSPIPQLNSSEFTKNRQICAGQERPWPCKRSSALFEPRAAPSVRKTPLFYGLGTKLQITIF